MNNMRYGFTMVELIFVIVIIGVLAAVAIPKLAVNRDRAQAAVCSQEHAQFMKELTTAHTTLGHMTFLETPIGEITNISVGNTGTKGIMNPRSRELKFVHVYECDDVSVALTIVGDIPGGNALYLYVFGIHGADTPVSIMTKKMIAKKTGKPVGQVRLYKL